LSLAVIYIKNLDLKFVPLNIDIFNLMPLMNLKLLWIALPGLWKCCNNSTNCSANKNYTVAIAVVGTDQKMMKWAVCMAHSIHLQMKRQNHTSPTIHCQALWLEEMSS